MEQDKEPDTWELHCRHKGQSRIVNINPQQSWGDLKKTLETIFGAPSSSQKIICRGKKVVDDQSIATTKGEAKDLSNHLAHTSQVPKMGSR